MINIVITMAGLGSRFKKAGYKVPKYEIEVKGKTLFEWSLISLKDYWTRKDAKLIFINRKENSSANFIDKKCKGIGIEKYELIEIDDLTDGQATTAMLAKSCWDEDGELVIYNIDTYIEEGGLRYSDISGDGYIPCFKASGNHWSFVKLDNNGRAIEVREKVRVSDNCTIGLYYFKTCKLYAQIYDEYYSDETKMEKNEKYVAPLYNYMIQKGYEIKISIVPYEKVHVLGTPQEVEEFAKE